MGVFFAGMKSRRLFLGLFFLTLIIGLIGNSSIISWKNFGRFSRDKGYSYNIVGDKIGLRITSDLSRYIEPFEELEDNLKAQFYEGLGSGIAWRLRSESPDTVIDFFNNSRIKKERLPYLYRGWGMLFLPIIPMSLTGGLLSPEESSLSICRFLRRVGQEGVFALRCGRRNDFPGED